MENKKLSTVIVLIAMVCLSIFCDGGGLIMPNEHELEIVFSEVIVENDRAFVRIDVRGRTQAGYFVDVEILNPPTVFNRTVFLANKKGNTIIRFNIPISLPNVIFGQVFNDFDPLDARKRFVMFKFDLKLT